VVVGDDAEADLDNVVNLLLAVIQHRFLELEECGHAQHQQADEGQSDQKLHSGRQLRSRQGTHFDLPMMTESDWKCRL
jgi:hypothetical protein